MTVKTQMRLGRGDWSALGKHAELIVHDSDPPNAEPPLRLLGCEFLTPCELFYVRSHGTVPKVDASDWRLTVDGLVEQALEFSLPELRERFSPRTVTGAERGCSNRTSRRRGDYGELELELEPGEREILVRAVESSANVQPERPDPLWNFKGYVNNAWHRVQLKVREG